MATSPASSKIRAAHDEQRLHGELLVDEILTRLPVDAAVRFRAVCKEWHAALTSDHFVNAHAAARARRHPEIIFFSPTGPGSATSFYACSLLSEGAAPVTAARELLTVGDLAGERLVLSGNKPCRGLTLVFDVRSSEYYVFNFSTGEHAALPPCEPAEEITGAFLFPRLQRFPLELSSTGLGFDPATGEHKVVRLFRNTFGQQKCEVCAPTASGVWRWRRCAGGDAPPGFACHVDGTPPVALDGYLYWLLHPSSFTDGSTRDPPHDAPIQSLSVGTERFGWVRTPPRLSCRIRHLTSLDGSLCAVVHDRLIDNDLLLLTWSRDSPSWSLRYRVDVGGLPRPIREELSGEREIVPLCSVTGAEGKTKKVLLATSRHKVFSYDVESGNAEEVFDMNTYVEVPRRNSEAQLFLNIGLHEERIAGVGRTLAGGNRLQVKRGGGTSVVGNREVPPEVYQERRVQDDDDRRFREHIMQLAFPD